MLPHRVDDPAADGEKHVRLVDSLRQGVLRTIVADGRGTVRRIGRKPVNVRIFLPSSAPLGGPVHETLHCPHPYLQNDPFLSPHAGVRWELEEGSVRC